MKVEVFIFIAAISIIFLLILFSAPSSNSPDEAAISMANFELIDGQEYLSFNVDTKIVYYMFSTQEASGKWGFGYSYFAPYLSENGKFCKYIDGKIVEVASESTDS